MIRKGLHYNYCSIKPQKPQLNSNQTWAQRWATLVMIYLSFLCIICLPLYLMNSHRHDWGTKHRWLPLNVMHSPLLSNLWQYFSPEKICWASLQGLEDGAGGWPGAADRRSGQERGGCPHLPSELQEREGQEWGLSEDAGVPHLPSRVRFTTLEMRRAGSQI